MKKNILFAAIVVFMLGMAGTACALPVSTIDLWDVSRGAIVTAYSPVLGGSDIRNMFGGTYGSLEYTSDPLLRRTLFSDAYASGYWHYVEWHTAAPVTLGSFNLYAAEDNSTLNGGAYPPNTPTGKRSFDRFNLYARQGSSWALLYSYTAGLPYGGGANYPNWNELELYRMITPVTAQDFRAEFRQYSNDIWARGPRIMELDGYAAVPEPATLSLLGLGLLGFAFKRRSKA